MKKLGIESVSWKSSVPNRGIDAEKAFSEIESIRIKNEGELTDDLIVEKAKSKNSVIHDWFDWDDTVAAREHRRAQARSLLRSFHVVYKEKPEVKMRAYQVLYKQPAISEKRTVYSTTEEVLANPEARDRLIAEAIRMAMQFRNRFKHLHELEKVIQAIDETLPELALKQS